jgi:hypothetical protein
VPFNGCRVLDSKDASGKKDAVCKNNAYRSYPFVPRVFIDIFIPFGTCHE